MAEVVRADIAEFRGGNCLGPDAQLFVAVDAGDTSRLLEAAQTCYDCALVDQCGIRLSHLALRMARRGVRQTVIGGVHSDNYLPVEPLTFRGTEGSNDLEPLTLGDSAYSLDLIRGMVRSGESRVRRGNYSQQTRWQRWLNQDLPDVEARGVDRGRLAYLLAKKLFGYTSRSQDDRRAIDRDFVYELGALYAADAVALRKHRVPRCELVGIRQGVQDYLAVAELFSNNLYLTESDIKKMFGNHPDDPLTALNDLSDRLLWSHEVVIPQLRQEFNYTGPVAESKVKEICRSAPQGFEAALRRWFENAASTVRRLGQAELVLEAADAVVASSAAYQRSISAIDREAALLAHGVAESTWIDLEKVRALFRDGTLIYKGKAYGTRCARLLEYALRSIPEANERLRDIDLRRAVGFIADALQRYNGKVTDQQISIDWGSQTQLVLAYLEDVRALQGLGVADPYCVARYSPASVVPKMRQFQRRHHLPPFAINRALQQRVTNPYSWLEDYTVAIDRVCARFLEQTGVELEPNIAHFLTSSLPNPITVADRLVAAYLPLAAEYQYDDYLVGWMIRQVAAFWPKNPQRGISLFRFLARKGVFQSGIDERRSDEDDSALSVADKLADLVGSAEDQYLGIEPGDDPTGQPEVERLLSSLSGAERQAVGYVFRLHGYQDVDEGMVRDGLRLGDTDHLEDYVMAKILPKLKVTGD